MKIVDLTGQVFGKLTVIEKLQSSRDGSKLWLCKCACGNDYQASTRHLNRTKNTVRSCGCARVKRGSEHAQWTGYEGISGAWWDSHIKHSANCKSRKHLDISLTIEQAWKLFLEQDKKCYFTGYELIIANDHKLNTASLDRIDNTKGYHLDNVRWVLKDINMMKRTYSDLYFIHLCNSVSDYMMRNHNER